MFNHSKLSAGLAVLTASSVAWLISTPSSAQEAASTSPAEILQAEVVEKTKLQDKPHRVLIGGIIGGGAVLIDGDTGRREGTLPSPFYSNFRFHPQRQRYYVAETYWSRGNRGTRADLVTVYDATTLDLQAEISLPGRLISMAKTSNFALNVDGSEAYVADLLPSASVSIVDLDKNEFVRKVETPGCASIYAWGKREFSLLCANGSVARVTTDTAGKYVIDHSKPFFDAATDPVFEESVVNSQTAQAVFISFTGRIFEMDLRRNELSAKPWSLQGAAGLPPASTNPDEPSWRPGGVKFAGLHKAKNQLFVLMHEGEHWTHKDAGSEIWIIDLASRKLVRRIALPPDFKATALAVEQDATAQLYALAHEGKLVTLDSATGKVLRTTTGLGRMHAMPTTAGE